MKTTLKAELIRCVVCKKQTGFTLLELTIVLVMSGILAAIALPSFLNQASKAKQVEAKIYIGTLNRAQQAYAAEHNQFASDSGLLGISPENSPNYRYSIAVDSRNRFAVHYAESLTPGLRPYVGMAAIVNGATEDAMVETILCESKEPVSGRAARPTYRSTSLSCNSSTNNLN